MKNAPLLDFPKQEFEQRHNRLLAEMAQKGIDVAMFTTQYNVRYFCGFQSAVWVSKISTPGLLLVAADGRRRLIGSRGSFETMRFTSSLLDDEFLHYGKGTAENPLPASFAEAVIQTLNEFGAANGRVGMELGTTHRLHVNQAVFNQILAGVPTMQPIDFTGSIWEIRSVKSAAEVEMMRSCARISEAAYKKALASVQRGRSTENDVNRVYCAEAYRLGAERQEPMIITFGKGRYNAGNSPPSDKIISGEKHEVLSFDGGPIYRGYYSDTIRMAVVGGLSPRQADYYKMAKEALSYTLGNIKEGVRVNDIMQLQDSYIEKQGFAEQNRTKGWSGHGIGLEIHEPPTISAGCDTVLKAGNVLAIEPCIGDDELGHFAHEENILVTKTGYELISNFLPDITVL